VTTRTFILQAFGHKPQRLTATATDTYRPCHRCSDSDGEYKTVTVYRVSDPPAPWWVTREIHCCAGGHSEIIARWTSAVLCAAGPAPAEPDTGPVVRAFTVTSIDGSRRSTLIGTESDRDCGCEVCGRPYGLAYYELIGSRGDWWGTSLEVHWCDGCGTGHLGLWLRWLPVTRVAPPQGTSTTATTC
jgi:hypothetical protein